MCDIHTPPFTAAPYLTKQKATLFKSHIFKCHTKRQVDASIETRRDRRDKVLNKTQNNEEAGINVRTKLNALIKFKRYDSKDRVAHKGPGLLKTY
jgi:hypothetical protein